MKKLLTLFYALILLQSQLISAQSMLKTDSALISAHDIKNSDWLDIDNNEEHELILQTVIGEDSTIITSFSWENFSEDTISDLIFTAYQTEIEDMDNNNQLDIIGFTTNNFNQKYLSVLSQIDGEFEISFRKNSEDVRDFFIQDWDKNGFKDLLLLRNVSDSLELSILKNYEAGFDSEPQPLLKLKSFSQISFLDINQNDRMDILATSKEANSPMTPLFFLNHKDSIEIKESNLPVAHYKSIGLGDFNHDGKMDFFSSFTSNNGGVQHAVFLNEYLDFENYIQIDISAFEAGKSFLADFNADGLTDVFINNSARSAIIYQTSEEGYDIEILNDSTMRFLNFYDKNSDGKLDLTTFSKTDSADIALFYWENQTPEENLSPDVPSFHAAFQTKEGLLIMWNDAEDDHTKAENITYDIFIGKDTYNTDYLAPNFDINSSNRLKTMRGNNFYGNELKLDSLPVGTYNYGIQPIDNSLALNLEGNSTNCGGRYMACGEVVICESVTENMIKTCIGENLTLGDSSVVRNWYSEQKGFLGTTNTINYEVTTDDMIYSSDVEYTDCSSYQNHLIEIIDVADFQLDDVVICEAEEVALNFPYEVDSLKWYSVNSGYISKEFASSIFIDQNDQISFEAYLNGCLIEGQFSVNIDNSKVEITNNTVEIKRGGAVQLNATGAVEFDWSPSQYLSQSKTSNPIASPETTTKFSVKGISTFGCVSYDTVEVKVLQEAFIPELFTPNGDSKNDNLIIYGLMDVMKFEFIIYDREGNIVFKTNNPNQMRTSGWDGTNAGSKAEAGVYFWQVRGNYSDGVPIQLNGEQKGKVLLSK